MQLNKPAVPATAINGPNEPTGKDYNLEAQTGVQHYSEKQLAQIARLAPIKYCTLPEYYLSEAVAEQFPKSPRESTESWRDRQSRAPSSFEPFYPYLRNLIVGTALRKGVNYDKNEEWEKLFKDVDLEGTSLNSFAKKAFAAALDGGVAGLWADYPSVEAELSAKQERDLAYRPWGVIIKCEDILELRHAVRSVTINNRTRMARFPTYLRLRATYEPEQLANEFYMPSYPAVRVYELSERVTENGDSEIAVRWTLMALLTNSNGENKDDYQEVGSGWINKPFIPFVPLYGGEVESYSQARPQLLDIARLNLHHWVNSANLANNIHNTSFDVMYGTGIRSDEDIDLESDKLLTAADPQATFGILSPSMSGADAALKNLERLEKSMESLAAVAVTTAKPQAESGFSKLLDRAQSDSQLAVLVQSLQDSLNLWIEFMAEFVQGLEPIEVSISKDFIPVKMHSQQVMATLGIWERSPMPIEMLMKILEVGMVFEGIPNFNVKETLGAMGLKGTETSFELGYAMDKNQKPEREPGQAKEPGESGVEAPESLSVGEAS